MSILSLGKVEDSRKTFPLFERGKKCELGEHR
jgi:hypothetical protein